MKRLTSVCLLMFAGTARSGIYDPANPVLELTGTPKLVALAPEEFRDRWAEFTKIGMTTPETKYRQEAVAARKALESKPHLTLQEQCRLGVLKLRMLEFDAAISELQTAYRQNQRDFWTATALGTAFQQTDQLAEAEIYLDAARQLQPVELPAGAKTAEATQLKLVRLRLREQAQRSGPRAGPAEDVDDLFGVKFVNAAGDYEPGQLAPSERAKLPADAVAIVQQLLIWLPGDARLYWLLGELYAADGNLEDAATILDQCADSRGLGVAKLRQHRQAVHQAIAAKRAAVEAPADAPLSDETAHRLWIAAALAVPAMMILISWQVRLFWRRQRKAVRQRPAD